MRHRIAAGCCAHPTHGVTSVAVALLLAGCASAGPATTATATEAEWRTLAAPRPAALAGAARLSITGVEILGQPPWTVAPLSADLALTELVAAGLIRRADVRFIERRRFAAGVAAEQSGVPRPASAPPVGISQSAEILASAVWVPLPTGTASIEVRLTEAARGAVLATRRATLPVDADLVATARLTVGTIMGALADLGRRPAWTDPLRSAGSGQYVASGVSARALSSFLAGLAAEESWRWEPARVSYQEATESVGFLEAEAALARAARLRLGGTLAES